MKSSVPVALAVDRFEPATSLETLGEPLSYPVKKMRLGKNKKLIAITDSLTLAGIPPEAFEYRLGDRRARLC